MEEFDSDQNLRKQLILLMRKKNIEKIMKLR
jgi:hypothetical protein